MRRALALVLLLACGPVLPGDDDDSGPGSTTASSSTGAVITTSIGSTSGAGESTTSASTSSTTSVETGAAATTSVEETLSFLHPMDMPGSGPCDPWSQDCPEGEKCTWYADDGGSSWNNTKCVPVVENPTQEGEPCFAPMGGLGGIDDCDLGLMCWDTDAENKGICVVLCHGAPEEPFCDTPKMVCAVSSGGFGLCLRGCDPLLQDCDPSDVCIESPTGGFLCVLDASGDDGQQHDPCMYANACDPGLLCADVTDAVECDQNAGGCCQPFCDLTDPDADAKCGGVGQVCTPPRELTPEFEHVGHCAVPE